MKALEVYVRNSDFIEEPLLSLICSEYRVVKCGILLTKHQNKMILATFFSRTTLILSVPPI